MDVVYPLIRTKDDNAEFRFSLRSLSNIEHGKVFVVGHNPKRIQNVIHIPFGDIMGLKALNVINKLKAICNDDRVSEDFVLMNDDFFILEKTEIKYYNQGKIEEHLKRRQNALEKGGTYAIMLKETLKYFPKGLDYSLHVPFIYNKKKLLALFEKYDFSKGLLIRNMYGNEYKVGGEYMEDVKHRGEENIDIKSSQLFISSGDSTLRNKNIFELIRNRFQEPSQYELLSYIYYPMEKVKVKFLKALYPYRAGEVGELKGVSAEKRLAKGYVELAEEKVENTPKKVSKKEPKNPVQKRTGEKVSSYGKSTKKITGKSNKSMEKKAKSNK